MAKKTKSDKPVAMPEEVDLSVLRYREDGEWVALALEMDIRGYGATADKAFEELGELVAMQLSFAHFKGQPELIWRSAEPKYWRRFRAVKRQQIQGFVSSSSLRSPDYAAGHLSLPPAHVIAKLSKFSQADA